ncbi:hypothetical protein [Botrimarina sp.]|uniref:hypothetical protein n=1 Tax=Botrimarina sp. TaxID=2795802 RepID=UPI0032EE1471
MKTRFAAFAAALALASVGCNAVMPGAGCGEGVVCGTPMPSHVAASQMAPRPGGPFGHRPAGLFPPVGCDEVEACMQNAAGCQHGYGLCHATGQAIANCPGYGEAGLQADIHNVLDPACHPGCGPGGCGPGGFGHGGGLSRHSDANYNFTPGPPTGQVAYPYYTTRGPRDFLMANPPSIGPR